MVSSWELPCNWVGRPGGVDLDPKAVETAQKTGATTLQGGFPDTGLPSAHLDIVTLSHVIEHVHGPLAALREAFRVLKT